MEVRLPRPKRTDNTTAGVAEVITDSHGAEGGPCADHHRRQAYLRSAWGSSWGRVGVWVCLGHHLVLVLGESSETSAFGGSFKLAFSCFFSFLFLKLNLIHYFKGT